jgi:hypothetical protein
MWGSLIRVLKDPRDRWWFIGGAATTGIAIFSWRYRVRLRSLIVPRDAGEFWTAVTGIGTIVVILVAYRGLRSIKLTKADILTRGQRDSRSCAIERCEELAHKIIPNNAVILQHIADAGAGMFVKSASEVRFDPDNFEDLSGAQAWLAKLPREFHTDSIHYLNRLEAWSMYFTCRLADHSIAFGPCAPVFCQLVVQFYPMLLARRAGKSSGKYPNVVYLFTIWRDGIEAEKSGVEMKEIVKRMVDLQAKRVPKSTLPPPLGADQRELDGI